MTTLSAPLECGWGNFLPFRQNARIEHDSALQYVMMELLADHIELFKQFSDNPSFKKWLSDTVFQSTYQERLAAST